MSLGYRLRGEDLAPLNLNSIQPELATVISDLTSISPECEIIVFGSFAKGLSNEASDLDLAVILPNHIDKRQFRKSFFSNRTRLHLPIDFIFRNQSEYFKKIDSSAIDQEIFDHGIKVYPKEPKWQNFESKSSSQKQLLSFYRYSDGEELIEPKDIEESFGVAKTYLSWAQGIINNSWAVIYKSGGLRAGESGRRSPFRQRLIYQDLDCEGLLLT